MGSTLPAAGERRAASGLSNQYRVAAHLIYRALRFGELTAIRIADVDAGRVDDLQILRAGRCDAYQVKWSQYPGSITFHSLVTPGKDKPSLIRQLADGWKQLRAALPDTRVVVHLTTNDRPSVNDQLPADAPAPTPDHFAAFLAQAWIPVRQSPSAVVAPPWERAWEALRQASGLSAAEFNSFVRDCELDTGFDPTTTEDLTPHEREVVERDRGHLAQFLFTTAGSAERVTEVTRSELVRRLGWAARVSPVNQHEWPPGFLTYRPVAATATELTHALDTLTGGYVAVTGTPGSGKSTLLAESLRLRRERVVQYFAFVPDAQGGALRGEAVHFLLDVSLALENQGVWGGDSVTAVDRTLLIRRLHQQMTVLKDEYLKSGRKTILLIDGLDHIEREQRPERSLLADLPSPDEVPEGVIIVLGTQTDELSHLPNSVQVAIREPTRRITMRPLDREAVFVILERTAIPESLDPAQQEQVFLLSEGHPLALTYLLRRLSGATSTTEVETILSGEARFTGRIETQYQAYWRSIGSDDDLKQLFGLLARVRGGFDLRWVDSWASDVVVDRLQQSAGHYFRAEGERRYFLHNSFRLFLEAKTAERPSFGYDEERNRRLHRTLAQHCATAQAPEWQWEELYNLSRAGDHASVLAKATQPYFRTQVESLRPLDSVLADIKLALASAAELRDPVATVRLVLAYAQTADRHSYVDDVQLATLFHRLGQHGLAVRYARDGNRLLIKRTSALRLSSELVDGGFREEARRLFSLAEPHDLLARQDYVNERSEQAVLEMLRAWAQAAVDARSLKEIISTTRRLRWRVEDHSGQDAEEVTRRHQNSILDAAAGRMLSSGRRADYEELLVAFDASVPADREWAIGLRLEATWAAWKSGDRATSEAWLASSLQCSQHGEPLDLPTRVGLAEAVARVQSDLSSAERVLGDTTLPERKTGQYDERTWEEMLLRFRVVRLLSLFGDRRPVHELIPSVSGGGVAALEVEFERDVCRLARLAAHAWAEEPVSAPDIPVLMTGILRRFPASHERSQWAQMRHAALRRMRRPLYLLLIQVVESHGSASVLDLRDAFEREWRDRPDAWHAELRRDLIAEFARTTNGNAWARQQLEQFEGELLADEDPYQRVRLCQEHAEAYLAFGDSERGLQWVRRLVQTAVGVGSRKDYQMDNWVDWLERIIPLEPEAAAERSAWLARAVAGLKGVTEKAHWYAAERLLAVTERWSSGRAVRLMNWLSEQRVLSHQSGVLIFLRGALRSRTCSFRLTLEFVVAILPTISAPADDDIVRGLLDAATRQGGLACAEDAARRLLSAVNVYSLGSTRSGWRGCLAEALRRVGSRPERVGLTAEGDTQTDSDDVRSTGLELQDGGALTRAEVTRKATTVAEILALLDAAKPDSFFDWGRFLLETELPLTRPEALTLANRFRVERRGERPLAELSRRLRLLGDRDSAWQLGEWALERSVPEGWLQYYDGGSRLIALRALKEVDADRARELAFRTFANDVRGKQTFLSGLAPNIADLLPLVVDPQPVQQLWPEIEQHLHTLFAGMELPAVGPELQPAPLDDTPEAALVELIRNHLLHPAVAVARAARRCLGELLLASDPSAVALTLRMLAESEASVEPVLQTLDAVSSQDAGAVAPFRDAVSSHSNSVHYPISQTARSIAGRAGWSYPALATVFSQPPMEYTLLLPGSVDGGSPAEAELVAALRPYDEVIGRLAHLTDVPESNLLARATTLMRQLTPPDRWSADGEERYRAVVEAGGLDLIYRGPRLKTARSAVGLLAGELVRFDLITARRHERLNALLRCHDPAFVLAKPDSRPAGIAGLRDHQQKYVDSVWANDASEGHSRLISEWPAGAIVLAEETTIRHLAWELPAEVRRSMIVACDDFSIPQHREWSFPVVHKGLASEYPSYEFDAEPFPFVIQNFGEGFDTPGEFWLALNPAVAAELEWRHDPAGRFRWLDCDAEVMVESVWWVDGPITLGPPNHDDEVAEGWLVIATAKGMEAIRRRYPNRIRLSRISRILRDEGKPHGADDTRVERV